MDIAKAGQILVLMLLPTLVVGAALHLPRGIRLLRRLVTERDVERWPQPRHDPIERLASDLRRLLREHEALKWSTDAALRTHLRALEGAITDCATEAARALDVPCPDRPVHGGLAPPELRRLLRALAEAGLVLPPKVGLLAGDTPQ
jgi:DNA-binding transcriptional ArsR family regulator